MCLASRGSALVLPDGGRPLRRDAALMVRVKAIEYLVCVRDLVRDTLTRRLMRRPQFEVLATVVEPVTVPVMHNFFGRDWSSK